MGTRTATKPTAKPKTKGAQPLCGMLFARLAHLSRVHFAQALERTELKPAEFALLHQLDCSGPASQLTLSRALRIHPSNLVGLLDAMQRRGLLDRTRDPDDRRRHLVELTPAGARLLVTAKRAAATAEEELLAPLSPGDRRQLRTWLVEIAAEPGPKWRC